MHKQAAVAKTNNIRNKKAKKGIGTKPVLTKIINQQVGIKNTP